MTGDRDGRAAYLTEVCALLWPEPASWSVGTSDSRHGPAASRHPGQDQGRNDKPNGGPTTAVPAPSTREFILLPRARRPRLLVPAERRPAGAAVRRRGEPGSAAARLATRGLGLILRSGLSAAVLRDRLRVRVPDGAPTIESYLSAELGRDVRCSVHLSGARANRKPVLQLLTASGRSAGFAKIGVNPLTMELVRAERDALTQLGETGLARLTVPRVLHYGSWQGLTVLVLSPLPAWQRRARRPAAALHAAMREVAGSAGIVTRPLTVSGYWQALSARLAAAPDGADRQALLDALAGIGRRAGDVALDLGAWHGDWTPWNMASTRAGLLVWDWERFTVGVPLGFDLLHYWVQARVADSRRDPRLAARACAEQAPDLLAPFGLPADLARLTAQLYLAELSARYLTDRQAEAGARLGTPGRWLIPALTAVTAGP